ncbi:MAG: hypothetical protein DRG59_13470, partial [Deltaproteobacteria bacterium]
GGALYYNLQYGNNGNAPADDVYLTYTLPAHTAFRSAWWHDWQGQQHPFTPDVVTADYVVWDLGTLENGPDNYFEVRLGVDDTAAPGALLTSTLDISRHPSDFHYDDNSVTWTEILNPTGPNLEIDKQNYYWNGNGQIQYEMRVKNRGDERLEPVWITDTYPISTTWDGNWWYGHGPNITTTHDTANRQIVFWLEHLDPGETASINYQVDLDGSLVGVQGLFFTNTLEADVLGDTYPADNYDEVVAYAGPDVYIEKWLRDGEPHPGEIVTFTVKFGNRNSWQGMNDQFGSAISDTLPPAMEFITSTAPWDPNQRWHPRSITGSTEIAWDWGPPWENSAWYALISVRISETVQSGDVLTNYVAIGDDNSNNSDLSAANDFYEFPLTILDPVFEVDKVYESNEVAGTLVTYTLTVTNSGNYAGHNVVLSDTIPTYLENVGSGGTLNFGWLWWHFGVITPDGGTATAWFSATLPCTASLSIVNDDYGVRGSEEGVTSPPGDPVSFDVRAPTINAAFTHTPDAIVVNDTVYFTGTASTDGTGLSYTWAFGDGAAGSGLTGTHAYTQAGSYTVVFTATDTCGYSDVATATITVASTCTPLTGVSFTYAPSNPVIQSPVTFTATVSPTGADTPITYTWYFGDGVTRTVTIAVTTHTYTISGSKTVSVTAYNPCTAAGVDSPTQQIEVGAMQVFLPLVLLDY